jgi:hypothetical protein
MKAIDLIEVIIDFNRADFDNSIRSPTHTGGFGIEEDSSFAVGSSGVFKIHAELAFFILIHTYFFGSYYFVSSSINPQRP